MPSALEVRDALKATLAGVTVGGAEPQFYDNPATGMQTPAIVVTPGSPWFTPVKTFGPLEFGRRWTWLVLPVVSTAVPEQAFSDIAEMTDAVVAALFADVDLGGEVVEALVTMIGPPDSEIVGSADLLASIVQVQVRT